MPGSPRPYPRRWPFAPRCCRMKGTPQRELRRGRISSSWENNGDGNLGIVGMEVDFSVHPFIDGCSFFLNQPFLDTSIDIRAWVSQRVEVDFRWFKLRISAAKTWETWWILGELKIKVHGEGMVFQVWRPCKWKTNQVWTTEYSGKFIQSHWKRQTFQASFYPLQENDFGASIDIQ